MTDLNDALLQLLGPLAWLPWFPVGLLLLTAGAAAWASIGARHLNAKPVPPPLITQGWVWTAGVALAVQAFLVVNFLAGAFPAGVAMLAWTGVPAAITVSSLHSAVSARRRRTG